VFLVSHDRAFLDNVVTSTIAYEGDGHWREYEGGVQDWLLQSNRAKVWSQKVADIKPAPAAGKSTASAGSKTSNGTGEAANAGHGQASQAQHETHQSVPAKAAVKKLSFKEQRELDSLPGLIEALEQEQAALNSALADGSLYVSDPQGAADNAARAAQIDDELLAAMERWEALSQRVPNA
jgi:ATP-binding cassette subfamily F protein uup